MSPGITMTPGIGGTTKCVVERRNLEREADHALLGTCVWMSVSGYRAQACSAGAGSRGCRPARR
jgi:hypothetical protein